MDIHTIYDRGLEYIRRCLLALDMFGNTILGGQPGDSISHRAAVARDGGQTWGCVLCRLLDRFIPHHCDQSIASFNAQVEAEAEAIKHTGTSP